ncbi:hypothetical protein LER28_22190, partial [Pseudomonas aeruginosa]|uniref:hypothetical protein n=1 Tax=Pseudomonas aeruginosa TaxID=287 RepID=UPI00389233A2
IAIYSRTGWVSRNVHGSPSFLYIDEGCNEGQGYLYSKPLPARELTQYLKQARRLSQATSSERP